MGRFLFLLWITAFAMSAALTGYASSADMYFASDEAGEHRVMRIHEGSSVWVVVHDPDQNIGVNIRDRVWANIILIDPHTGAYVNWDTGEYYGSDQELGEVTKDFLEETGVDTGLFVSNRAVQIGGRQGYDAWTRNTHVTGPDFISGNYSYLNGSRVRLDVDGRLENMDTLVGMYQDPDNDSDVALTMLKLRDSEAVISWNQDVYENFDNSATITIMDPDENLSRNDIEYVPVFIIVNSGSWNPVIEGSPSSFGALLRSGGVDNQGSPLNQPVHWHSIYNSSNPDALCYIQYPTENNVTMFDTQSADGITRVAYYAQETGENTGVFQLSLSSIADDLGFNSLRTLDVLTAYYLDPNDFDDFTLATAYIEERQHSTTSFTDSTQASKELWWLGRDPVYVEVIDPNANMIAWMPEDVVVEICNPHGARDSEWMILDETSVNSADFFTFAGTLLLPVWDALGVGLADYAGGYQLMLDNWKLEAFNEDSLYVRYNDVGYITASLSQLGDLDSATAFPPLIREIRVANDVSFDLLKVADTQVYDGSTVNMYFLDRQGNRTSGYVNSECVFIEVIDLDQNEDSYRREKISGTWDGQQGPPSGPLALNRFDCGTKTELLHPINHLLGDTDLYSDGELPKVYVLNPRNGRWAAVDLLETGVATGDFVSTTCIELPTSVYECFPTLGSLPGDTIVAVYQDPSNHSDSAWISIKYQSGEQ